MKFFFSRIGQAANLLNHCNSCLSSAEIPIMKTNLFSRGLRAGRISLPQFTVWPLLLISLAGLVLAADKDAQETARFFLDIFLEYWKVLVEFVLSISRR